MTLTGKFTLVQERIFKSVHMEVHENMSYDYIAHGFQNFGNQNKLLITLFFSQKYLKSKVSGKSIHTMAQQSDKISSSEGVIYTVPSCTPIRANVAFTVSVSLRSL